MRTSFALSVERDAKQNLEKMAARLLDLDPRISSGHFFLTVHLRSHLTV